MNKREFISAGAVGVGSLLLPRISEGVEVSVPPLPVFELTPENLYNYAEMYQSPLPGYYESIIAQDAEWSCLYARHILHGPFPVGEAAISQNTYWSYIYAQDVLKGPFPAGEAAIAQKGWWSFLYATHVLNKRFPAGVVAIRKSIYWEYYCKHFHMTWYEYARVRDYAKEEQDKRDNYARAGLDW